MRLYGIASGWFHRLEREPTESVSLEILDGKLNALSKSADFRIDLALERDGVLSAIGVLCRPICFQVAASRGTVAD